MSESFSVQSFMSVSTFWNTINILLTKFNTVNKRLWSSKILHRCFCKAVHSEWQAPLEPIMKLHNENVECFMYSVQKHFNLSCEDTLHSIEIVIIELIPKKFCSKNAYQLVCLDKDNNSATFYDITSQPNEYNLCPNFTYSITLEKDYLVLRTSKECNVQSQKWLSDNLLPQVAKWGNNNNKSSNIFIESLSLVSTDKYYKKYNELKLKYGKSMVEIWPERTDPSKYVYEDVAIAAYLLLLWDKDSQNPQKTFVDLGCGNGLLVYILTEEGHDGIGIDVRKRHIWDLYPKSVKLQEKTIIPSDANLFPDADWLIGNHSDELTPWVPVIAARSSYKCNFFLLPCCAYNFDGSKYQRKDSSKSQYTEYIRYIETICDYCGFKTNIDRLKIPSTKRICLVGRNRSYPEENHLKMDSKIQDFIDSETTTSKGSEQLWATNFKPRESIEKVRNCTQIDKTIIESVIRKISECLLEDYDSEQGWSVGKSVDINEIVSLVSKENLKAMKAECGGLQTLLKNNHHIFKVQKGKVQLRYPRTVEEVKKSNNNDKSNLRVQLKPCWFFNNHPKGCPLSNETCSYSHVQG